MVFVSYQQPRGFRNYLAAALGTRKWIVTPRLTKDLKARGYDLAISRKRFTDLRRAYLRQIESEEA